MRTRGSSRGRERADRDRRIALAIERWFAVCARDLPWRAVGAGGRRDPYRSLVSEFMLQQTQVARVAPAFERFTARFPTVASLASAPLEEVVRHWEGLGYYRRAGLLHRAATAIVEDHAGAVPESVEMLRTIPGIGPYTAGAVASIVFGQRAPIVDANVRRVVLRIEGREADESPGERTAWVWKRAEELVRASDDPGAFNEGVMELGAKVCAPRSPRCGECPVALDCRARARGSQLRVPTVEAKPARVRTVHQVVVIRDRRGRALVEQRPAKGMWAGLWQFPTHESGSKGLTPVRVRDWAGVRSIAPVGRFSRATTHRAVEFEVWTAVGGARAATGGRVWVEADGLGGVALSVPHRLIAGRVIHGEVEGSWAAISPRKMAGLPGLC